MVSFYRPGWLTSTVVSPIDDNEFHKWDNILEHIVMGHGTI